MNIVHFLKRYPDILMNQYNDDIFNNLQLLTGGTTSSRIAKLLNFSVGLMEGEERYVEVGVFTGSTLCAAAYHNEKICIGIDNYLPEEMVQITQLTPEMVKARCRANIQAIDGQKGYVRLIEKSFRDVKPEEIGGPVAVSFIDGKHDYAGVVENLKWLDPMLADHAILVFDDINYIEVSMGIQDWLSAHQDHYDFLAYVKPCYGDGKDVVSVRDRFINNGVCVIRYHRDITSNTFSYDLNKLDRTVAEIKGGITC
jgi:Methyltransferase domain